MQYTKTVKVPCHWETTEQKINYLDNLTARLTYAVRLWSDIIKKDNIKSRTHLQNLENQHKIKEITKLSAGFVQQCGNKALWMWKQYRTVHRKWKWKVAHAKQDTKYFEKSMKLEENCRAYPKQILGQKSLRKIKSAIEEQTTLLQIIEKNRQRRGLNG